jgi:hypothetical protein
MKAKYGLTIYSADGDTIYGAVSRDRAVLMDFLEVHRNEGAVVQLKMERPDGTTKDFDEDSIVEELSHT